MADLPVEGEVRAMAAGTNPGAVGDPSDGACRLCR